MNGPIALDVYETIAERYSKNVERSPWNAYYERPAMLSLVGDLRGKSVLELGCGNGFYLEAAFAGGAVRVAGVDCSPAMAAIAQERTGGRAEVVVAAVEDGLPMFADGSFDVVLCPLILHYVKDWGPALREARRLLSPGGSVTLSVGHPLMDYEASVTKRYAETELLKETWSTYGVTMPVYRRSLQAMFDSFADAGFVVDRLVEPLPVPELEAIDPGVFKILQNFPNFICFRLQVRGGDI
ncbi:MAG TPA: methyltransferase domain-containing protein [Labilithrix sp.]|nr:methyltransferase domain-containing protein [Labilithrix sp.]